MGWTTEQRKRLAYEKQLLERYFPSLEWANPISDTYVYGELLSNAGKRYLIRLEVPNDYPENHPSAYITYPHPLQGKRTTIFGKRKSLQEASAEMHTLSPHSNGYVQVCHNNNEFWTSALTLYQVVMKVRLWLEAYEGHLATGKPIDHYLAHINNRRARQ